MTRVVTVSAGRIAKEAAARVAAVLRARGRPVLVLASGTTMIPVYRELSRLAGSGRAPFHRARMFGLDELRVPAGDNRSFRRFLERHLFSKVEIPPDRIHFWKSDAADPERECRRYEAQLSRFGPPSVVLLGIGVNGHVAYLEPGHSLPPRSSCVRLSARTRRTLGGDGMRPVPSEALTMGIETILSARELLLVVTGRAKAAAIAAALTGPITPRCPASFLTLHAKLTVLLDPAAASKLRQGASDRG